MATESMLHEIEAWASLKEKPIWLDRIVSELGVEKTLEVTKAIRFNQENKAAIEFVERVMSEELDRRLDFLM
jgi:recombinational DNA repair protein RecR